MTSKNDQPQQAWYWHWFWYEVDLWEHLQAITDRKLYYHHMYLLLDANGFKGFNIRLFCVASLGFLASSYSLFATSIIWPALDYVYASRWNSTTNPGEVFDMVTLGGIILGMILFGHLADRVGRKRLYGLELIIILIATIGILFSSNGYAVPPNALPTTSPYYGQSTLNVFTSVTTWRFFLGVGIGAEYPMSAIIATEFASTQSRGTTIAGVFFMQSVGRIIAFGFADAFLQGQINAWGVSQSDPTSYQYGMGLAIDETWRFVAGFGGVFAVIAIALRLTIPESPRYYASIAADLREAMAPAQPQPAANGNHGLPSTTNPGARGSNWTTSRPSTKWMLGVCLYLTRTTAWRRILTICVLWFLLDVCFYGTGLDSPSTLNLLWTWSPPPSPPQGNSSLPWENNPGNPAESIYDVLYDNGIRAIWVSSISPLIGGFIAIMLINYVSRRNLLLWTSSALCIIFFITGALVWTEFARPGLVSSTVFYALAQFFFNLGPNTVVFILAAEIFPTMFRGTLYGLAAASGKAGALLIRPFVQIASSRGQNGDPQPLAGMLFAFGAVMMTIAFLSWFEALLPEVQELPGKTFHRLNNIHLEDIAPNPGPGELC